MNEIDKSHDIISTRPKRFCFVLMPFSDDFKDIYEIAIKEACRNGGAYCERVDDQDFHETSIFQRIINQISQADFIIADMSGKNANVFYEVGYAHALDKPTVLLTNNASDIPFDLKHFPHLVYDRNQIAILREMLTKKVKWYVENPVEKYNDSNIKLELFFDGVPLSLNQLELFSSTKDRISFDHNFTIHNDSVHTMEKGSYTISLISNWEYYVNFRTPEMGRVITYGPGPIALPDGKFQYTLRDTPTLLPGSYESIGLLVAEDEESEHPELFDEFVIKFLTENGSREFHFQIECPTN